MTLSPQTDAILQVVNLSKKFREIKAVDDLTLTVAKGDIYGFLGPNGSGKSTTIRMMLTLLEPDQGEVRVFGMPLHRNRRRILRNVGAFIEKADFYEYLSAFKNLEILCGYTGIRPEKARIREILELVGLQERAGSPVKTFSKGMKQRLGIAQALLHDPELLILDEPASGLDPVGNRDIRELIRYLNKEKGKTIILSSHNLGEIEMIANRMVIINKGKKVIEGDVQQLLTERSYRTRFTVDDPTRAVSLLRDSRLEIPEPETDAGSLALNCTRQAIPDVNATLVAGGIRVESIRMEQSLEDYFLNMTWDEHTA